MRKSQQQKRENKKISEWEKEGFSGREIQNKLKSYRKKVKILGNITKGAIIVVGAAAVGTATYLVIQNNNNKDKSSVSTTDKTDELIDSVINDISKDESENTKTEFDNFKNDKIISDDITIPDNISEEEKTQIEEKILYLKIFENLERLYSSKYNPITNNSSEFQSSITEITDIYQSSSVGGRTNCLIFNIKATNCKNGVYFTSNSLMQIQCPVFPKDMNELNEQLQTIDDFQEISVHYNSDKDFDMNQKIFDNFYKSDCQDMIDFGYDYEILLQGTNAAEDVSSDSMFYSSNYIVKISNEEKSVMYICKINYKNLIKDKTKEEFVNFIDNNDFSVNGEFLYRLYDCEDLDWQRVVQEYNEWKIQQTPEAQAMTATEKFTTTDASGEQGFDWNAYQQAQATKTQKTQTPKETTSPVIYDDLTL